MGAVRPSKGNGILGERKNYEVSRHIFGQGGISGGVVGSRYLLLRDRGGWARGQA